MITIHDHGNSYSVYHEIGFGLTIKSTTIDTIGTITGWELYNSQLDKLKIGSSKEDLMIFLNQLIIDYNLKYYSKAKKDLIIIYTDNIEKVLGFLYSIVTNVFSDKYIEILNFIEVRNISKWKDLHNAVEIGQYAQFLIDTLFVPDKYFYLTPNQVPRKRISKSVNCDIAKTIFPTTYGEYQRYRKALFGGIVYVPYKGLVIEDQLMCLDLTSAYIFDLLIELHCSTSFKLEDSDNFEYFLESTTQTSIGFYKIKYFSESTKVRCFKSIDDMHFEPGEQEVECILTSIDLKNLKSLATIVSIECDWLYSSKLDHLPKYLLDEVVKQYKRKQELPNGDLRDLQKSIVNGIFGDCIKKIRSKKEFYTAKNNPSLAPQWGIWCTAYARKNLLALATKMEGWVYSDTDSIYCFDNEHNRNLLKEYNENAQRRIKEFCNEFGYDYDILKDLGTFKIEKIIKRFKAHAQKIYMYETIDGEFKLVAAGLDQHTIDVGPHLFETTKIDWGSRTIKVVEENNYYEKIIGGKEVKDYNTFKTLLADEQY